MMMECPRCGFSQPKDRYCASCGLDVDAFNSKPKPFFVRLIQNPNLHLSLIVALLVLVVGYIFYLQRGVVTKGMDALFNGTPLSSRDSLDRKAAEAAAAARAKIAEPPPKPAGAEAQVSATQEIPEPPAPAVVE